jgi:hypothetical protein
MSSKRKTHRRKTTPASHLPQGWTVERARAVAAFYDNQSDDDAIAEAEAQYNAIDSAMMQIPVKLIPAVQKLLEKAAG